MEGMELIRHRRSVRTFDGRALTEEDRRRILLYAQNIETPFSIPVTWRLLDAQAQRLSSPVIVGAKNYIAGKVPRTQHAEEAFGFAFEKLVLYAESIGLGTTWIAGTMNRPAFEAAMSLKENEVMPCVSPLGYPAPHMSLRETMMRKGIRSDSRLPFGEVFFDGDFGMPLAEGGKWQEPLEMVRWAPSAVNKQPWRVVVSGRQFHFFEQWSKGYVDAKGWDLQKIDIGIAMCHFAYGMKDRPEQLALTFDSPRLTMPEATRYIATITVI